MKKPTLEHNKGYARVEFLWFITIIIVVIGVIAIIGTGAGTSILSSVMLSRQSDATPHAPSISQNLNQPITIINELPSTLAPALSPPTPQPTATPAPTATPQPTVTPAQELAQILALIQEIEARPTLTPQPTATPLDFALNSLRNDLRAEIRAIESQNRANSTINYLIITIGVLCLIASLVVSVFVAVRTQASHTQTTDTPPDASPQPTLVPAQSVPVRQRTAPIVIQNMPAPTLPASLPTSRSDRRDIYRLAEIIDTHPIPRKSDGSINKSRLCRSVLPVFYDDNSGKLYQYGGGYANRIDDTLKFLDLE